MKRHHEIRDPIHVFIKLDSDERRIVDSRPFQRLRHIRQLALTSLVYPGATHSRFEHSLGVMELATRMYDVVTADDHVNDEIKELLPPLGGSFDRTYWRRVLRVAALCHDMGHLPFSHAAEKDLLPEGWTHERLSEGFIRSPEISGILDEMKLKVDDVVRLALGPEKAEELSFDPWETLLAELIVGDAFGSDRMDYLLRDSHHLGVAYGRFDYHRLIDTLRILRQPPSDESGAVAEVALGVEEGGLRSAEALLLARYFMFSQVYLHPIRRIYDIHLADFLKLWLPGSIFSTDPDAMLAVTDNEVLSALADVARQADSSLGEAAERIVLRRHFKEVYAFNPGDRAINPDATRIVFQQLRDLIDPESV